jgi:hypothetical protein
MLTRRGNQNQAGSSLSHAGCGPVWNLSKCPLRLSSVGVVLLSDTFVEDGRAC